MARYLLLLNRLGLSFEVRRKNNIRRRRNKLVSKLRIVASNLLFLLFLDFLTVYLDVGVCHPILLFRKKIIDLRSSGHSSPTNSYSRSTDSISSSSRYHLTLRVFKFRNIHGIFFSSKLLKDRYRKWPGKRLICFAGDGELDIIDIDILLFVVRDIIR